MKKTLRTAALLCASSGILFSTASCMGSSAEAESRAEVADAFAGKTKIGQPERCIATSNISSTNVVSGRIIDFNMRGNKVYRSVLPARCPGLAFEETISYEASFGQLCRVEQIRVVHNSGGRLDFGASCSLGPFQQIADAGDD